MDNAHQLERRAETTVDSDVDFKEVLLRKRKPRAQRACYACRQRKVKCNYETPCQTCVDREHPELCQYQLPSKRPNNDLHSKPSPISANNMRSVKAKRDGIWDKIKRMEEAIRELKEDLKHVVTGGEPILLDPIPSLDGWKFQSSNSKVTDPGFQWIRGNTDLTREMVHLGASSVPAMVIALGDGSGEEAVRQLTGNSILPLFGLDNESATYPFVDLWGLPTGSASRIEELCKLLPNDADCLQGFRQYRDTPHVLYPGVVDMGQFEEDLTHFLVQRATSRAKPSIQPQTDQDVYGKNLHWVGLLFALLASGYQCTESPRKERQLTSQVYGESPDIMGIPRTGQADIGIVCCAYECLRTINFLARSTMEDIQTLLTLGNVLSNTMNAGVAWSLLGTQSQTPDTLYVWYVNGPAGLTIRLAQTLGLHRPCHLSSSSADEILRGEIWYVQKEWLIQITPHTGR